MNQHKLVFSFAWTAALLVGTPAMGQLTNFPVLPLEPGSAYGTTSIGAAFDRGVKNSSLRESVFVARVARGLQAVSFGADAGYIVNGAENVTVAGSMAVHLLRDSDLPVQVSLQSGLGWMRQDILVSSLTTPHIPVGIAIQGTGFGRIKPWVMPRVSFIQSSGEAVSTSRTVTKLGGSAGISVMSDIGVAWTCRSTISTS
jgi:hypothetical protein